MRTILFMITTLMFVGSSIAQPKYASEETKETIEKMINAHGGYDKWLALETQTFTTAMHSESLGFLRFWINSFRIYWE